VLALSLAPSARAAIPSAEKVRQAVAAANTQAGRARPLWLDVVLTDPSGGVGASGRAALVPGGVARLELALADGRVEIHERDPAGYHVTRDGVPVEHTLPLLPPAQLLQAGSEAEVSAALAAIGGDPEQVDLGADGGSDCWVLGGRDAGPFAQSGRPSFWFDMKSRRPARIDEGVRARFRFGPSARYESGFFPSWMEVEAPGWPIWRMQIQAVTATPGRSPPTPPDPDASRP
jgi:hypothetical protein